jgi:exonuclease SbcD
VRILHTADAHLGLGRHSTPGTSSRIEDFAATIRRFAETAIELKVDAALIPGDVFHTRRPTPRDLTAFTEPLALLSEAGVLALFSSGNHDGPDQVGNPSTNALAWMHPLRIPNVRMVTEATSGIVRTPSGAVFSLVAIPYPHKRTFDALMPDLSPDERTEAISRQLEDGVEAMIETSIEARPDLPLIFMGHVSTVGAAIGTEVSMRFGWDVTLRSGILDKADYGALGHIHRQQQVGQHSYYSGSPEYMDFGEEGQPKGFILAEIQRGKPPKTEVIDSKPRPMRTIDIHRKKEEWRTSSDGDVSGHILRLRVHPDENEPLPPSEVVKMVREYRSRGATYVKSEVILPERQRSVRVEVDPQVEAAEALRRWLSANGYDAEPYLSAGIEIINSIGVEA